MSEIPKITPCLWFNFNAEEAVNYYLSVFKVGKILDLSRYGEAHPELKGQVLTLHFELHGQTFMALNAGPEFPFTPAISLMVDCVDQAEVDDLWAKLIEGGEESMCGWLTDKFGLSWQIIPHMLLPLISDPDPKKAARAMEAMMTMRKIDIARIQAAYDGA